MWFQKKKQHPNSDLRAPDTQNDVSMNETENPTPGSGDADHPKGDLAATSHEQDTSSKTLPSRSNGDADPVTLTQAGAQATSYGMAQESKATRPDQAGDKIHGQVTSCLEFGAGAPCARDPENALNACARHIYDM